MLSLVIPLYKNEANLDRLLQEIERLAGLLSDEMEMVFIVDGSPDRCFTTLSERLPEYAIPSQLISLSRNFGSVAAVAAGLEAGNGDYFAVLAADLQEPIELIAGFTKALQSDQADIVFGCRSGRSDPWLSELLANSFWRLYRWFVVRDMPKGGVDVFACTRRVRDQLLLNRHFNTNLVAALFWLGFRRLYVSYERQPRKEGISAWTLAKKLRFSLDSVFTFTDLPVRILLYGGVLGLVTAVIASVVVLSARFLNLIHVPGYTPILLAVMFFGALSSFGFGIIGQYLWLCLQSTQDRPPFVVSDVRQYRPLSKKVHFAASAPD